MFTDLMGILLAAAGVWDLFYTRVLFKKLKSGQIKTDNSFMVTALGLSFLVGVVLVIAALPCVVSGVQQVLS